MIAPVTTGRVWPEPARMGPIRIGEWLHPIVGAPLPLCGTAQKCENGG